MKYTKPKTEKLTTIRHDKYLKHNDTDSHEDSNTTATNQNDSNSNNMPTPKNQFYRGVDICQDTIIEFKIKPDDLSNKLQLNYIERNKILTPQVKSSKISSINTSKKYDNQKRKLRLMGDQER